MKFLTALLLLSCLSFEKSLCQGVVERKVYKGQAYQTLQVRIDSAIIKNISLLQNFKLLSLADLAIEEAAFNTRTFLFNACINDSVGQSLGLFVSNGLERRQINLSSGTGNFYMKPNGVLMISKNDVRIIESSGYLKTDTIITAIQSGPMLILDDSIHADFNPRSSNFNLRSGVGIFEKSSQKYLLFAVSENPTNFYDFASFFKEIYSCKNALCLESVNTIFFDSEAGVNPDDEEKIVANYLKVVIPQVKKKNDRQSIINMELGRDRVYRVPVEINDIFRIGFVLDSTASEVSISPGIAQAMLATGCVNSKDFIGKQTYVFANGTKTTRTVLLKKIKIGDYIFKNIKVRISDSTNTPMLVGRELLLRLGKIAIDVKSHQLIVFKS